MNDSFMHYARQYDLDPCDAGMKITGNDGREMTLMEIMLKKTKYPIVAYFDDEHRYARLTVKHAKTLIEKAKEGARTAPDNDVKE